jgi:hypothetical protein
MKRTLITLIMTSMLGVTCLGETLVIEIMKFDCTDYPELFEKYSNPLMPKTDSEGDGVNYFDTLSAKEKVLGEIEKVAKKTLFLNHSQKILIGEKVDLVTQLQDYEFKLKASTKAQDNDLIHVSLDFSLSEGKHNSSIYTEITVSRGQTIPIGGGVNTQTTQDENGVEKVVRTVSVMRFKID